MRINGTIINYYFHCKRQCYLFAKRINMEDNSEDVRIGRVLHQIKAKDNKNSEIKYDNMAMDKVTDNYVIELKKSDADIEAARMQVLFYLDNLEKKGIVREGKLVFEEKTSKDKVEKIVLNNINRLTLQKCEKEIQELLKSKEPPKVVHKKRCQRCAYYEYCYL